MKKIRLKTILGCIVFAKMNAQIIVSNQNVIIDSSVLYGLTNPVLNSGGIMTYNPGEVPGKGAAFRFEYSNQGGTNFDGYSSGKVGAVKAGGTYYPGNPGLCGMPVQIQNLDYSLRVNWNTLHENAFDLDDKWWATINVIFDSGTAESEPVQENRDFDLVIQQIAYQQDSLVDIPDYGQGRYWYFARNSSGEIVPFSIVVNGEFYQYAVRYKFFNYPAGDPNEVQNDKVHIKFIPLNNDNKIPFYDHPIKSFIDCAKNYIGYLNLTPAELALANDKVADPQLWIKTIAAGFEVYDGQSVLINDFLFVRLDSINPLAASGFMCQKQTNSVLLQWDDSADQAFDHYKLYRSVNNMPFELYRDTLRVNQFTDLDVTDSTYSYFVRVVDRSFNESPDSDTCEVRSTLSLDEVNGNKMFVNPNPFSNEFYVKTSTPIETDEIKMKNIFGQELDFELIELGGKKQFKIVPVTFSDAWYILELKGERIKLLKK